MRSAGLDLGARHVALAGGDDDILHRVAGHHARRLRTARALVERSKLVTALAVATNPLMPALAADAELAAQLTLTTT